MKVIRFNNDENTLKLQLDSFDDMYLMERIVGKGDNVESRSFRRFRANETDIGEQKEVVVKICVEKTELDKGAAKLRFTGKIIKGHPEEFVKLGSYHTINVGEKDAIEVQKSIWKDYILKRIKQAVSDTKKPRLGVVALDEEKATIAYVRGYGIDIITEIYSHLSKRLKESDFEKQKEAYFGNVIKAMTNMQIDIIVIAGPGFTKDNLKKYIENKEITTGKKLVYTSASDSERSGVREAAKSDEVAKLIVQEHIRSEFRLLNTFLKGLNFNSSHYGAQQVKSSLDDYKAGIILVNDNLLNDEQIQSLLDIADNQKVEISIFNSDDEAGMQLANFKGIASISRSMLGSD